MAFIWTNEGRSWTDLTDWCGLMKWNPPAFYQVIMVASQLLLWDESILLEVTLLILERNGWKRHSVEDEDAFLFKHRSNNSISQIAKLNYFLKLWDVSISYNTWIVVILIISLYKFCLLTCSFKEYSSLNPCYFFMYTNHANAFPSIPFLFNILFIFISSVSDKSTEFLILRQPLSVSQSFVHLRNKNRLLTTFYSFVSTIHAFMFSFRFFF